MSRHVEFTHTLSNGKQTPMTNSSKGRKNQIPRTPDKPRRRNMWESNRGSMHNLKRKRQMFNYRSFLSSNPDNSQISHVPNMIPYADLKLNERSSAINNTRFSTTSLYQQKFNFPV